MCTARASTSNGAMVRRVTVGLLIAAGACGGGETEDPNAEPTAAQIARGETVYREVCSECHSIQPPPRLAPPLSHVASIVRGEVPDRAAFTQHIVTYVQGPSEERSLLPVQAIRRFGLMPAQTIDEARLRDAAAFVWTLADSAQGMTGRGGGPGSPE